MVLEPTCLGMLLLHFYGPYKYSQTLNLIALTLFCDYSFLHIIFSAYDFWFYVPVVATHIGGVLGSVFYDILIGLHWPDGDAS